MNRYFAFLRGINVGGKNLIRMDELRTVFISLGFSDVATFIQSGNVRFGSDEEDSRLLAGKIGDKLERIFKSRVAVMIRTKSEIGGMLALEPFTGFPADETVKLYACFMDRAPALIPPLPLVSGKEGLEVIRIEAADAFVVSRSIGKGRYGFPGNYVEKELKVVSTARNWTTIQKMYADSQ